MATAASNIRFLPVRQGNNKQTQPGVSFFGQARPIAIERTEGKTAGRSIDEHEHAQRFREAAMPYLNDVYTLARFLLRNEADAEDAVQECYLRALRYFSGFRGPSIKPWLFTILRNVCRTEFVRRSSSSRNSDYELEMDEEAVPLWQEPQPSPEAELLHRLDGERIRQLISELPASFREALVLREVNELNYHEIANVTGVPVGTVMSRLARARSMLRKAWLAEGGTPI
jgi:RNA polymerase sigma-70 factor (ECF subfamily)